eukprot:291599_1
MESVVYAPSIMVSGSTDASNKGGGFMIGEHWGAYKFKDVLNSEGLNHRKMHINLQEAHAVIMLLSNFRSYLSGKKLLLYIDNTTVYYGMRNHWAKSNSAFRFIQ